MGGAHGHFVFMMLLFYNSLERLSMTSAPDDDPTMLAPTGSPGAAGTDPAVAGSAAQRSACALAPGTRLGEFEILSVLGQGGFGIVYLAYDSTLERKVALKEYMPAVFAARTQQLHVSVLGDHRDTFEAGLRSFVNEARILAQFDHPALLKVYRFWEANGTAYMVMPFYQGPTFKQLLCARTTPLDEASLRALLDPLLDTLGLIHAQQCFHRDIAPDNILILGEHQPLLLDFGAARRAIAGMDQAFTVIVKQNYAPIEQYAELPGMQQGPWTDLFALAAVIHFAIDGHPPPPAVARSMRDPYVPLAQRYAGLYSEAFLTAIDRALAVKPADRPQSAAEFRQLLGLADAGAHAPSGIAVAAQTANSAKPPSRRRLLWLGALAAGLAIAAGTAVLVQRRAVPAAPAVIAAAPVVGSTVGSTVASTAAPAAAVPATTAAATAAAAPAPFDPIMALRSVVEGASPDRVVSVRPVKERVLIDKDHLAFTVRASHPGYVYVLMVGTDRKDFFLLFPNKLDSNNRIRADQTLVLPRKLWKMQVHGPAGVDQFAVIVSDTPRDFTAAALEPEGDFARFPIEPAAAAGRNFRGMAPLFAGVADCGAAPGCSQIYGAGMFAIEEAAR